MQTVTFVHGTGVRLDAYDKTFAEVEVALAGRCKVQRCYWGHLGSALHHGGASIPKYDTARSLGSLDEPPPSDEDYEVALWGVLAEDPLYELRVLGMRRGGAIVDLAPGEQSPGTKLAELAATFEADVRLRALLEAGGIDAVFKDVRHAVLHSAASTEALAAADESLADCRSALARAWIAQAAAVVQGQGCSSPLMFDAELRDELERALVEALGSGERSIGGWLKDKLGGLVCRLGMPYVERRRGAITDAAYPAAGDILLYQARGEAIRNYIAERVSETTAPRIILAHSLGGIASVDLLASRPLEVELLVTVGSQTPFLYEIDALSSLAHGQKLPAYFPRWLNIYDLRDLLSYIGAGIFPERVTDVRVDNRAVFPASHSAYWANPAVWAAIEKALPA